MRICVLQLRVLAVELEQRPRMHADHAVDDEFQPRQAHAAMRDAGEVERAVGVADIHHDLHSDLRQRVELDLLALELEQALVDVAGVAFGARHRHFLAFADQLRSHRRSRRRRECPARAQ